MVVTGKKKLGHSISFLSQMEHGQIQTTIFFTLVFVNVYENTHIVQTQGEREVEERDQRAIEMERYYQ